MRLLLDTRAYLWWLADDPRLTDRAREIIASRSTVVHVSAASLWEIAVKVDLGRLEIGDADLVEEIAANGFVELPVSGRHATFAATLPRHHDNPFDRVLVAQALVEHLTLTDTGRNLAAYELPLLEAVAQGGAA